MSNVIHSIAEGILTLTLNRPEKKNAITDEMYGALADGIEEAESSSSVRAVLIGSNGDSFTAGNDLGDFASSPIDGKSDSGDPSNVIRFLHALARLNKPVVASVRGQAVGIGLTMLLHCDIVFVADDARLSAPFVSLALVPEAASSLLLTARLGHARAFAVFAAGQVISGIQAVEWGLANQALAAAAVDRVARDAARLMTQRPLRSLMATKSLMRSSDAIRQRMALEGKFFAERLASPEAKEAFRAFAERRAPNFAAVEEV